MAIALIGFGAPVLVSPAAQTMEVPLHASTANGHLVLCFVGATDNVGLSCPETGVTELAERQVTGSGEDRVGAVYSKLASSEPANWTIDLAGGVDKFLRGVAVTLSGVDSTTPEDATTTQNDAADTATHATPAITTVTNGAWVFSMIFGTQTGTSTGARTAPSGYTEDIDEGAASFLLVAHKEVTPAGTETPGTWGNAGAGADHVGFTVSVRPAAAGGGIAVKSIRHFRMRAG